MPFITLELCFVNGSDFQKAEHEFELTSGIQDSLDEVAQEYCDDFGEGWGLEDFCELSNDGFQGSWDLDSFDSLERFAEFADRVEEHGTAYEERAADLGDTEFDFHDEYNGCWDSVEEFVQNLVEDCYDLELPNFVHVDWERTARDVMMDYSEYEGEDGTHIFRDC